MQARRKARDNRARGHVADHHRARSDQRARSNFDSAHHDRAAADRRTLAHHGVFHLPVLLRGQLAVAGGCARIAVVDEDNAVADEDFVLDGDAGAYEGVSRDFTAVRYFRVTLSCDEPAEPGFVANLAAVEIYV